MNGDFSFIQFKKKYNFRYLQAVKQCCTKGGYEPNLEPQLALSLSYDTLVELVEHLKACLEIAVSRTGNWQRFCIHHEDTLPFLLQVSCLLDEGKFLYFNFYSLLMSQ